MIRSAMGVATFAGMLLLAFTAQAQNDGHMDEVWMEAKLKAKVNLVDYSGDPPYGDVGKEKLQAEKGSCYVVSYWEGADSYEYTVCTVCQDADGDWDDVGSDNFYEVDDGKGSIVDDWASMGFLAEGDDYDDGDMMYTEGYTKLTPKMKDGEVKSVKVRMSDGSEAMVYRDENSTERYGTGPGKLKLKVVDAADVPEDAQDAGEDCFD